MKIYVMRCEAICENELENIISEFPDNKKEKVRKFVFKKDKIMAAMAEVLLKMILIQEFNLNSKSIVV